MTDKELFDYRNHPDCVLTPEQLAEGMAAYDAESRERAAGDEHLLAFGVLYVRALEQARALGYEPTNTQFLHNPIVIVDEAAGEEASRQLMLKHDFTDVVLSGYGPNVPDPLTTAHQGHYYNSAGKMYPYAESMWDVYGWRRISDTAVLVFIGDDRTQEHWVAVAWEPEELVAAAGYIPSLV